MTTLTQSLSALLENPPLILVFWVISETLEILFLVFLVTLDFLVFLVTWSLEFLVILEILET